MNKTDRDFAERLVLEVQKRPAIYVPSHPDHKDRYKIDLEWTLIAAQLNSTAESVKRRWQNLRGSFSKSLAALKNQPSGSATKPVSRFYLFEQMKFLQHHMAHAPMHGNYGMFDEQGQDDDEEQAAEEVNVHVPVTQEEVDPQLGSAPSSPTPSASSVASTTSGAPRAKKRPRQEHSQPWEEAAVQYLKNKTSTDDPDLNFFKGLLPMVKGLRQKNKLKFFGEVTTLLFNHIEQQDTDDSVFNILVV